MKNITALLALGIVASMTTGEDVGIAAPSNEQIKAAALLDESVRQLESSETLAKFQQARALREMRDTEAYKLVQGTDGKPFQNWGQYVDARTNKSQTTVSQNITVVTAFSAFSDEELAKAGPEKLYVAHGMFKDKFFTTIEGALEAAQNSTRADLMAQRNSTKAAGPQLSYLSSVRVPQSNADRFAAAFEKFQSAYSLAHGDEGSVVQVSDFFIEVVGGLPMDFLNTAAQGQGGAAPEMADGWTPKDVAPQVILHYLSEKMIEGGHDPQELMDAFESEIQGYKDRFEIEEDERKTKAKLAAKDEANAAKALDRWKSRLTKVTRGQQIFFADGAKVEVQDTNISAENTINGVWVRGIQDGSENVFPEVSTMYAIETLTGLSIVEITKPVRVKPEPKVKVATTVKGTKAAGKAKGKVEEIAGGISKAKQAGRKAKPTAISEGTLPND